MEGYQTPVRKPRASVPRTKKEKSKQDKAFKPDKPAKEEGLHITKTEPHEATEPMAGIEQTAERSPKVEPKVKEEYIDEQLNFPSITENEQHALAFSKCTEEGALNFFEEYPAAYPAVSAPPELEYVTKEDPLVKQEPTIKQEPFWDE